MTNINQTDREEFNEFEEYLKSLVCTDKGASIIVILLLLTVALFRVLWPMLVNRLGHRRLSFALDVATGTQHAPNIGDSKN